MKHTFSDTITKWYDKNKRDLPWRHTQDPYKIWLSEIILQQTRVEQGLPYYNRFIQNYPTLNSFAKASEKNILKLWQGLGYYSRARNMLISAKEILSKHNGIFPKNYEQIIKLKGIGSYTAAAISSFVYNQPYAVVDGNVYRVLARYRGIKTKLNTSKGKKEFFMLAQELLDKKNPGRYNQAIMEFGAMQCKAVSPNCNDCPLKNDCFAYHNNCVDKLPVKSKRVKVINRYFNYLVLRQNGTIYLNKRKNDDIWKNLYDFPLIETKKPFSRNELIKSKPLKTLLSEAPYQIKSFSNQYKHVLTHQNIYACFCEINLNNKNSLNNSQFKRVKVHELKNYPVPKLIHRYLENKFVNLKTIKKVLFTN